MKKDIEKKYDAFISYRHQPLDMFVAKTIQKKLEEFKLPKNIERKQADWERKTIERVFRDQDELPLTSDLSDQIYAALCASDYLIVICSPRIKESLWCQQEIQAFVEMKGFDHVLAVLIEGEPKDAFPDEIMYRTEYQYDQMGNAIPRVVAVEPLAADVRGTTKKEIKKKIDNEIFRLLAPMFDVDFDDLKQRHHERRVKKGLKIAAGIAACFTAFGIFAGIQAIRISDQNKKIDAQSQVLISQYEEIKEQKSKLQEQNDNLAYSEAQSLGNQSLQLLQEGYRKDALEVALQSVTENEDGISMPVTPEGIHALLSSTYGYETLGRHLPEKTIEFDTEIKRVDISPEKNYVLVENADGIISILDTHTYEEVGAIDVTINDGNRVEVAAPEVTTFLDEATVVYANDNYMAVYDFINDKTVFDYSFRGTGVSLCLLRQVCPDAVNKVAYFLISSELYVYHYDTCTMDFIADFKEISQENISMNPYSINFDLENHSVSAEAVSFFTDEEGTSCRYYLFGQLDLESGEFTNVFVWDFPFDLAEYTFWNGKLYAVGSYTWQNENYISGARDVICYDYENEKVLWSNKMYSTRSSENTRILTNVSKDGSQIATIMGKTIYFYDTTTGKINYTEDYSADVIYVDEDQSYDFPVLWLGLSDGLFYGIYCDRFLSEIYGNRMGNNMCYMNSANGMCYSYSEKSNDLQISAAQLGFRVDVTDCKLEGSERVIDPSLKTIYFVKDNKITAKDIETSEYLWSVDFPEDLVTMELYLLPNGSIFTYGKESLYLLDASNGDIIYSEPAKITSLFIDESNNSVFYYNNYEKWEKFNTDTRESEVILSKEQLEKYNSFSVVLSEHGDYAIVEKGEESGFDMINLKDGTPKSIDLPKSKIREFVFIPETNCFLVHLYDDTYEVYDNDTVECIYHSTEKVTNQISQLKIGGGDIPYVLCSGGNLCFMDKEFHVFFEEQGVYYPIYGSDYFGTYVDNYVAFCPYLTVDMLKEDATKLLSGEVSTIYPREE